MLGIEQQQAAQQQGPQFIFIVEPPFATASGSSSTVHVKSEIDQILLSSLIIYYSFLLRLNRHTYVLSPLTWYSGRINQKTGLQSWKKEAEFHIIKRKVYQILFMRFLLIYTAGSVVQNYPNPFEKKRFITFRLCS